MSIFNRVEDAEFLWEQDRVEGAILSACVAVAATARLLFPKPAYGDRQAFEAFLKFGVFERISIEFRGELHPVYRILYKWLRCELIHEGGLPIDIELIPNIEPGTVMIRAGGAPDFKLLISDSWFHELIHAVKSASVNAELFATDEGKCVKFVF